MKEKDYNANSQSIDIQRLARLSRLCADDFSDERTKAELALAADYTYSLLKCEGGSLPFSLPYSNNLAPCKRQDIPTEAECDSEEIIRCAPLAEERYISVPAVIKEEA